MEVRIASQAAPGRSVNEDFAFALPDLVAVFDGVSVPPTLDTGCIHGPSWYVRRLGGYLAVLHKQGPATGLPELLAEAIHLVRGDHTDSCDLSHPGTPASTVCMVQLTDQHLEYLVLCDSPLVLDRGTEVSVITDSRFEHAVADLRAAALTGTHPIGSPEHAAGVRNAVMQQRTRTNRPDGYWIAAADPQAAYQAVTGTLPITGSARVRRAALLTDGASCAVDSFHLYDWRGLLDALTDSGPQALIGQVRSVEDADSGGHDRPRYKRHDDATAALCLFDGSKS
ncbi:hypothetical protein ACFPIJ_62750 [Dactylosporangium cerinum]|uniref:Integrase n=1 Tax=Dactylosporangium cerinum TaxID=1434730 RepID=A0ABV9WJY8_9ACTN